MLRIPHGDISIPDNEILVFISVWKFNSVPFYCIEEIQYADWLCLLT